MLQHYIAIQEAYEAQNDILDLRVRLLFRYGAN